MVYLVSSLSCQCLCAVFWPFQRDLVGFRFADFLSIEEMSARLAIDTVYETYVTNILSLHIVIESSLKVQIQNMCFLSTVPNE